MAQTPHYFIAIPLPQALRSVLATWQNELRKEVSYKIWPHPEDLHITLKFLGAVDAAQLQKLQTALTPLEDKEPFTVSIGSLGRFGTPKQPRVLWAGVEKTAPLLGLKEFIEERAEENGFPKENRSFRPHITLAKKWDAANKKNVSNLDQFEGSWEMSVNQVVIYQIFPNETPKYKVVTAYHLEGS